MVDIDIDDLDRLQSEIEADAGTGNAYGRRNLYLAYSALLNIAMLRELRLIRVLLEDD